ncbi:MAG: MBL fold metallo-hydrolase [Promethearchaeota archaeon]
MKLLKKPIFILLFSIIGVAFIGGAATILIVNADDVKITFLPSNMTDTTYGHEEGWMSSILIEYKGMRIYIDPYNIVNASDKADGIFITHPHWDHYDQDTIDLLTQDSTEFIGPASCTDFITENDATGVVPGDNGTIAGIHFTAIPAYNDGHPVENNWCGYVFTIEEYTILITGDTGNIPEFADLRDTIDVAVLPVGWSCSNLGHWGAIDAISVIRPTYVIPTHYGGVQYLSLFTDLVQLYAPSIEVHEKELILES